MFTESLKHPGGLPQFAKCWLEMLWGGPCFPGPCVHQYILNRKVWKNTRTKAGLRPRGYPPSAFCLPISEGKVKRERREGNNHCHTLYSSDSVYLELEEPLAEKKKKRKEFKAKGALLAPPAARLSPHNLEASGREHQIPQTSNSDGLESSEYTCSSHMYRRQICIMHATARSFIFNRDTILLLSI